MSLKVVQLKYEDLLDAVSKSHLANAEIISKSFNEIRKDIADLKTDIALIKQDGCAFEKTRDDVEQLKGYRSYTMGAIAIIAVVILPVLGFLSYEVVRLLVEVKVM